MLLSIAWEEREGYQGVLFMGFDGGSCEQADRKNEVNQPSHLLIFCLHGQGGLWIGLKQQETSRIIEKSSTLLRKGSHWESCDF
jgi:hypothetical protein